MLNTEGALISNRCMDFTRPKLCSVVWNQFLENSSVQFACTCVLPCWECTKGSPGACVATLCELRCFLLSRVPLLFARSCFITGDDHFLSPAVFFLGGLVSLDQIRPLLAGNFPYRRHPWLHPPLFAHLIAFHLLINSGILLDIFVSETVLLISPLPQVNILFAED